MSYTVLVRGRDVLLNFVGMADQIDQGNPEVDAAFNDYMNWRGTGRREWESRIFNRQEARLLRNQIHDHYVSNGAKRKSKRSKSGMSKRSKK
jgi:hypothetical protein